jgi:ABC-type amino acid transport substrate-binding protein
MSPSYRARAQRACLVILALLATSAGALAQESTPKSADSVLKVVLKPVRPFVFEKSDAPSGYSVELWRRVAQEAGLACEFTWVDTTAQMLAALERGVADVAVGALSITAERETKVDFSHSYFESGLQILVHERSRGSGFSAFAGLLQPEVLKVIGILLLALVVNSHLLWLMERRRNPESFPESYAAGVWESAWWSVCTLITGGCENKAPAGIFGRLVAIVWMLAGVGLFSYITATIASTMTVNNLTSEIKSLADLRGKSIGTVDGSTAQAFLHGEGMEPRTFRDVDANRAALRAGLVEAVVYDAPILRYDLKTHPDSRLQLTGAIFDKQDYGFGLRQGSPYRERINRALLALEEQGFTEELDKKWFGEAPP